MFVDRGIKAVTDISLNSEQDKRPQFYNRNNHCPILYSSAPFLSIEEAYESMFNPKEEMVCTEMPMGCRTSATFLLDTSSLKHADDVKADDNGSFRHQGRKMEIVQMDEEAMLQSLNRITILSNLDNSNFSKPTGYILLTVLLNVESLN